MSRRPAKQAKLTSYFLNPLDKPGENVVPETSSSIQPEEPQTSSPSTSGIQQDPFQPAVIIGSQMDIGAFDPNEKAMDQQKYDYLTNTWKPKTSFKFPRVERKVKGKIWYLSFQKKWLDDYKWLAYSPSQNGGFCKSCRIFAPERVRGAELQVLVKKPMNNYKDATAILAEHATKVYHQLAHTKSENFVQIHRSSQGNVVEQMSHHRAQQARENRKGVLSLIDIVKLCGRQMLSLRGHRDFGKIDQPANFETNENEGNFRALVRFRIQSGDQDLQKFIHGSAKNAQYTSWGIQNEIVQLCGEFIRKALVQRVTQSGYFSVLADETSDVSNCEQFSICIRYVYKPVDGKYELREDFLGFVEAESLTGEYLANLLLKNLGAWGLDLNQLRGQGYDGASNMSGRFRGVQALIKQQYPKATFTHCNSHCLNLVVGQACQVASIQKSFRTIKEVIVFISNSPKRMTCLTNAIKALTPQSRHTRLKSLCETRWVQRHEAVATFHELYSPILHALDEIEKTSDSISSDKAEGFQMRMRKMEFVTNLNILAHTLAVTHSLSVSLQSKTIDLIECAAMLNNVKGCLELRLANAEREFEEIFEEIKTTLEKEEIPTTTRGLRSSTVEDVQTVMLQRNYKPFLKSIVDQVDVRFGEIFQRATKCFSIIPLHMRKHPDAALVVEDFQLYADELDSWSIIKAELTMWQQKFSHMDEKELPANAFAALEFASPDYFPNIHKLLQILSTLPVTTATSERSFSSLRRLKTYLRNTMQEERLNGLALMAIHREIKIDSHRVLDEFAAGKARRINIIL